MPSELYPVRVTRVVDGDTIDVSLDGRRQRVRLIGIDTPEIYDGAKMDRDAETFGVSREVIRALGRLSSEFTRRHLLGEAIALELDVQSHDRYGRLLAYVWLEDGSLFNMLIVREGYAVVSTFPPNVKYAGIFLACERQARERRRGLWGQVNIRPVSPLVHSGAQPATPRYEHKGSGLDLITLAGQQEAAALAVEEFVLGRGD